jgi:peptidyl-prolyl cis-trans isomerase D
MVLLVLSFCVWGIGDIFRQGGGAVNVAKAGKVSITLAQYQRALHRRSDQMRQMLGSAYSPQMQQRLGIQVLFTLVNSALIDQEAQALGVRVGDDEVRDTIAKTPEFADANGHFDKAAFEGILRNNGMSEARYVEDVRTDIAARLLSDTVGTNAVVNDDLLALLYKAQQEQRSAQVVVIPANAISKVPEPTDAQMASYYAEHKDDFIAPQYRTFSMIALPLKDVETHVKVAPDDIRRAYEDRKQDFHTPEKRAVDQLVFENKQDADAAEALLAKGKPFSAVAKLPTVTNTGKTAMGDITRQDAPVGGDTIFALKEGQNTQPLQSAFGWHIFHVGKIEPEHTESLEEATPAITRDLAEKQAQDSIGTEVNSLEDALAGGATLDKAAAQVGEKVQSFGPVAQDGTSPDGKKVTLPGYDNLLKLAFQTGEKESSQMSQSNDGVYFMVHVDSVEPSHAKPFTQVKPDVIAAWKEQKSHTLLRDAVDAADKDLHAGKPLAAALAAHGIVPVAPVAVDGLKRGSSQISSGALAGKPVPHDLLGELFLLAPHHTTHLYPLPDGSYMVATLTSVTPAPQPADAKALQALSDSLKDGVSNQMLHDYLGYLRVKYGVSVNEAAMGAKDQGDEDGE